MPRVPNSVVSPWAPALALAIALAACDGDANHPDVEVVVPDAGADVPMRPPTPAGPRDGAADVPFSAVDAPIFVAMDARMTGDLASQDLPDGVTAPLRLVPGDVRLIGWNKSSCSNRIPPAGEPLSDRWCGFRRAGATAGTTELWVINISAAARSGPPPCDGTSPQCLRLTSNLWTEEILAGPPQDVAHKFDGDTLIFTAGGTSGKESPYVGPIWVWRPGWTTGRQLTATGYNCGAHWREPIAWCVQNAVFTGLAPTELDITAGSIALPTGPFLPTIEHTRVFRSTGERAFWVGFTDAGDTLVISGPRPANPATASLRLARIADAGAVPAREILTDVMNWGLANDEKKIYYFTNYANRVGTLMMADFPSGANPVQLVRKTSRYVILGEETSQDRGIGYFIEGTGRFLSDYRVVPDRSHPYDANVVFRYSGTLEDFRPSRDLRFTGYAKFDNTLGYNGYLARGDGKSECILNSELDRPAFAPRFLDHSALVFWMEESYDDAAFRDGWFGNPDGCRDKHRYARHIGLYTPMGDEGLIFGDEIDADTMTLRYVLLGPGGTWPEGGPVKLMDRVSAPVVIVPPQKKQIMFRVNSPDPAQAGLYLFDSPFGSKPTN